MQQNLPKLGRVEEEITKIKKSAGAGAAFCGAIGAVLGTIACGPVGAAIGGAIGGGVGGYFGAKLKAEG